MKIKTITCHEVYNHGASLQEYALLKYLQNEGHEAETIHYKPPYLSGHFKMWTVSNTRFNSNIFLKLVYLTLKLPGRIWNLQRKKEFDAFSAKFIKSTPKLYTSNTGLKADLPEADAYICGSDQIWNSFFENGKDPAFYLDFVPKEKLKLSYAASFAIDKLDDTIKGFVKDRISHLDHISVRESSGLKILERLGFNKAVQVLDPVFLLSPSEWSKLGNEAAEKEEYIFIYDFDSNPLIRKMAQKLSRKHQWKIVTVNQQIRYADKNYFLKGPEKFLSLVKNASFIISNSFHAVAFSIIYKKDFVVFNREYKINTRMRDLLRSIDQEALLILDENMMNDHDMEAVDKSKIEAKLNRKIEESKNYLKSALS